MRLLDTDVDLTLLALAVVPIVWAVQPAPQNVDKGDIVPVCPGTACAPAPQVVGRLSLEAWRSRLRDMSTKSDAHRGERRSDNTLNPDMACDCDQ